MTGVAGNIIYAAMKYPGASLVIPFGGEEDEILKFSKGGSFILCLVGGKLNTWQKYNQSLKENGTDENTLFYLLNITYQFAL